MDNQFLTGKMVRLTAPDSEKDPAISAKWTSDTEFQRLLEIHPVKPATTAKVKEQMEEMPNARTYAFAIRPLDDERVIGYIFLFMQRFNPYDCFMGIGIGERELWGKGYGTDALRILLRYAFMEMNMHRVSLMTLATNVRGQRSYEKCGFVREGVVRQGELRNGVRTDLIVMGCLRSEWMAQQGVS